MSKRCHRDLHSRAQFMGFDPELAFGASAAFAVLSKLGAGLIVSALVAGLAAWAMNQQRAGRLPRFFDALRDYLRWPSFHSSHGRDHVPRFPKHFEEQ
jgi:hypothetical protein